MTENVLSHEDLQALGITPAAIEAMINTSTCAWIAVSGCKAVGFSMILPEEGCLFAAFVLPAYEGAGIGKRLAEEAENQLFLHHDLIWLETGEATRAAGFYRHRGWITAGEAAAEKDIRRSNSRHGVQPEDRRSGVILREKQCLPGDLDSGDSKDALICITTVASKKPD